MSYVFNPTARVSHGERVRHRNSIAKTCNGVRKMGPRERTEHIQAAFAAMKIKPARRRFRKRRQK